MSMQKDDDALPGLNEVDRELDRLKCEIDDLLCKFVQQVATAAPRDQARTRLARIRWARALWEVASGGAEPNPEKVNKDVARWIRERQTCVARAEPTTDVKPPLRTRAWPFSRLRAWLYESQRRPDFKSRLEALGFASENSVERWKSQLKQRWQEELQTTAESRVSELQNTSNAFDWCNLEAVVDRLDRAVADGQVDSGLDKLRDALRIRTDWEDALGSAFRQAPDDRPRLIVGLYPPGREDETVAAAFGVERALGVRAFIPLDEEKPLVGLVEGWSPEPREQMAVLPCLERFDDAEKGLERLAWRGCDLVAFAKSDEWFKRWGDPVFVRLGALPDDERDASEDESFHEALDRSEFAAILRAASLFSARNRKLAIDQLARACSVDEDRVRTAIDNSHDLLSADVSDKVVRVDQAQAARYVARTYPTLEAKAEAYTNLFRRLDPSRPEDARAVRNIFTEWLFASPAELRLACRVMRALREDDRDHRDPILEFARCGPPSNTRARLRWTQILSWLGEHQAAHDLLLDTDREGDGQEFAPSGAHIEQVNARIFVTRYRATGRTQFLRLASLAYQSALDLAEDAERPAICEEFAQVRLMADNPCEAKDLLDQVSNRGRRWMMLRAAVEARSGGAAASPEPTSDVEGWVGRLDLDKVTGDKWHAYVAQLVEPESAPRAEELQQAAARALERGHFADAKRLLDRGLSIAPDNAYLAATHARLLHEQGRYSDAAKELEAILDDLVGDEHAVLRAAWVDSRLEAFRAGQSGGSRIHWIPKAMEGQPKKEELSLSSWFHLVALEAKAYWYDALCWHDRGTELEVDHRWREDLPGLCDALLGLSSPPPAPLRALAAKIRASGPNPDFDCAAELAEQAVEAARTQGRAHDLVVTLNTLALVWEQAAQARHGADRVAALGKARAALEEGVKGDEENTYSLSALARVLEVLAAATDGADLGEQSQALECRASRLRGRNRA